MIFASGDLLSIGGNRALLGSIAGISIPLLVGTVAYRHFYGRKPLTTLAFKALGLGLLYLSLPWTLLLYIRSGAPWMAGGVGTQLAHGMAEVMGRTLPLIMIASIWLNDTMAYLMGSFFGRTPLSRFSPKKTWEGTVAGVVLSVGLVTAAGVYGMHGEAWIYAWVSFLSSTIGSLGDLLESWLKRRAGVKDSGQFMPGHGGFLDRFDSLLLAVPAVWLFCMIALR